VIQKNIPDTNKKLCYEKKRFDLNALHVLQTWKGNKQGIKKEKLHGDVNGRKKTWDNIKIPIAEQ
jgi:hypothetical protein